jgi:hypothetical protein
MRATATAVIAPMGNRSDPDFKECDMITDDVLDKRICLTDPARSQSPSDDALDALGGFGLYEGGNSI